MPNRFLDKNNYGQQNDVQVPFIVFVDSYALLQHESTIWTISHMIRFNEKVPVLQLP